MSIDRLPPVSPARRHFMGIIAAGAGKLSAIAIASSVLAGTTKRADAMGDRDFDRFHPGGGHHCFGRGTRILTTHGEVPVEDLEKGTLIITTNGPLPIKWIGRKAFVKNASASWHPAVLPIRVSRFAIDDQTPQRDLYLSRDHCLLVDGVFIPVKHLVNGTSIAYDDASSSETIDYFSLELETHEAIFAEGTAAETFRFTGGQVSWDNLPEYENLYGEHSVMSASAPVCGYSGARAEMVGLFRLAASRVVDVRDPVQIAYDRIAARAIRNSRIDAGRDERIDVAGADIDGVTA